MTTLDEHFILSNGVRIPKIGFGTWQIGEGEDGARAVLAALDAGYRHIDTARGYGNEATVARAIVDSGIPRDEIFVTTKLPAEYKSAAEAHASFQQSMAALEMDYVDLYLIHAPWPWQDMGADCTAGNAEVWAALEEIHSAGWARAIGVSNFEVAHIESLLESATLTPQVNQIKCFVGTTQRDLISYCQSKGILVEGFSPLATGSLLDDADVRVIADRYGKSVAQLCIRYVLQSGVLPLPKTTTPARMRENADVDFDIIAADMAFLDGLIDIATEHHGPMSS
ncbi:aldo/keto reductase [Mycobacterium yunnanensis]|uniref:Aldo/keto reductase n=1 Tax=Mycobacterium yunnanensis TaxID=368477 RepID=A0A9X3C4T9_9MYCO|nr:aldo/keto reductase [Mycobacterium yunnanensis]MCV7424731.1 aldo/keto reductase [Mycobacterium yunnanensis]